MKDKPVKDVCELPHLIQLRILEIDKRFTVHGGEKEIERFLTEYESFSNKLEPKYMWYCLLEHGDLEPFLEFHYGDRKLLIGFIIDSILEAYVTTGNRLSGGIIDHFDRMNIRISDRFRTATRLTSRSEIEYMFEERLKDLGLNLGNIIEIEY